MDGKFQEEMIKEAPMDPPTMKQTTERLIDGIAFILTAANPLHERHFGLRTARSRTRSARTPSCSTRRLSRFAEGVDRRAAAANGRLAWRPPDHRRFLVGAKVERWVVVNYYRCVEDRMLEDFIGRFCKALQLRGVSLNPKPHVFVESHPERVKQDKMDPIHDVSSDSEWMAGRLFIGIDLSHGAPGAKGVGTPTVVGVCYNYNEKLSMTGGWIYQEAARNDRAELRKDARPRHPRLQEAERAEGLADAHHLLPRGRSDGEFHHVRDLEKGGDQPLVCRPFRSRTPTSAGPASRCSFARRTTSRLFPTQKPQAGPGGRVTNADRNVRPGTLITKGILNPNSGISLCSFPSHLHGGVLGSISLPAMLYHAGALSKRGRNNYMETHTVVLIIKLDFKQQTATILREFYFYTGSPVVFSDGRWLIVERQIWEDEDEGSFTSSEQTSSWRPSRTAHFG
ncbi:hypothetical protein M3Y99_01961300 [Aphelenchoides fujianensis]|nr:hypothetical protein M3Y99_01961300 [Aphelenchoides fujianensis]